MSRATTELAEGTKGFDVIAQILKAEGVEFIACYPRNPVIEACAQVGIRPIVCRQERVGIAIADGFSRATFGQRLGVFICQHGPGAENAFPGAAQAYSDNVPILLIPAGEPNARRDIRPSFSSVDNYAHVTKWRRQIGNADDLAGALRHAFFRLRTGNGGPVLLETAQDALFGRTRKPASYRCVTGASMRPDPAAISAAADALIVADNPVIHAGAGVLYAQASDALVRVAEALDAPVITTMPGKSAMPEDHPLATGASAITKPESIMRTYEESDCVFAIGSSLTQTVYGTSAPHSEPGGRTLIQATLNEADVHKEYDVDVPIIGDADAVLNDLATELATRGVARGCGPRAERNQQRVAAFRDRWAIEMASDEVPINQYRVIADLMRSLAGRDSVVTHDAGTPREQIISLWPATKPGSYLGWGKSTQLGFGLGAIMGAKLARPDAVCVNVMGDAAIGMVGMDLETAVRNRIGIVTVVLNNGIMAIESDSLVDAHTEFGANFVGGNYAAFADSLGAHGERVEQPDELTAAIERAFAAAESGQPALLEVMVKAGYAWPGRPGFEPLAS